MFKSSTKIVGVVLCVVVILLASCQAIQPSGVNPQAEAWIEQMKAEAAQQELLTFDLMIKQDWSGFDAVTAPNFYQIGSDGAYIERADVLAGVRDAKLVVRKPDLGEMRVEMITPDAYMVTYQLNFNGTYDGNEFSNPRTVASLWVKQKGKWLNRFLVDQERTAEFTVAGK